MATNQEYKDLHYDRLSFRVRKGRGSEYAEAAAALGIGKMEMFRRAVDEFIQNHAAETCGELNHTQPAQIVDTSPRLTGDEKKLIDAFNNLSPEAQKALLKFLDALQI